MNKSLFIMAHLHLWLCLMLNIKHLKKQKSGDWWGENIPHEVVGNIEINGLNPIKAWRLFLKLTQQQVADKIGMKQSAYSRIENNKTLPKQITLEKIAQGLGINLNQLD